MKVGKRIEASTLFGTDWKFEEQVPARVVLAGVVLVGGTLKIISVNSGTLDKRFCHPSYIQRWLPLTQSANQVVQGIQFVTHGPELVRRFVAVDLQIIS
ncbi:unnamed protein product [Timema podura]|uniref:Uncharacterized protein n=1 Tax=Timema podura TaxID=61482 RepID=A0ABN7P3P7_TIMPD|nr:unnamed protein product [Timema podura]